MYRWTITPLGAGNQMPDAGLYQDSLGGEFGGVVGMGGVWGICAGSARFSSLGRQPVAEAGLSLA